jgi:hypothetical protein
MSNHHTLFGGWLEKQVSVNFSNAELLDALRGSKELDSPYNILDGATGLSSENYENTLMYLGGLSIAFGKIKEKDLGCYTSDEWNLGETAVTMRINYFDMVKKVSNPAEALRYFEDQLLENCRLLGSIEKITPYDTLFLDKRLLAETWADGRFGIKDVGQRPDLHLSMKPLTKTPEGVRALINSVEKTFSNFPGEFYPPDVRMELIYNRRGNKQVYEGVLGSIVISPTKAVVRFPQPIV